MNLGITAGAEAVPTLARFGVEAQETRQTAQSILSQTGLRRGRCRVNGASGSSVTAGNPQPGHQTLH